VGTGSEKTTINAHEGILKTAPYFEKQTSNFKERGPRRITLVDEDLETVGSVVEFMYNKEYFPRRLSPGSKDSALETDPAIELPDVNGIGLLKHAKVYTLAEKLGLPSLKSLAHSKIHNTTSTPKGEIEYARYVYQNTTPDDQTMRKPVAAFWAGRSHVLRHEAEDEFRSLCLEFPQFGFDVLSLVLDAKEKQSGKKKLDDSEKVELSIPVGTPATGRKRVRHI
jgi:hypothetical protein